MARCRPVLASFAEFNAYAAIARKVARARQHEIAQPGEPRHGIETSPAGHHQAGNFREACVIRAATELWLSPRPSQTPAAMAIMLKRAPRSDADNIVIRVNAKSVNC